MSDLKEIELRALRAGVSEYDDRALQAHAAEDLLFLTTWVSDLLVEVDEGQVKNIKEIEKLEGENAELEKKLEDAKDKIEDFEEQIDGLDVTIEDAAEAAVDAFAERARLVLEALCAHTQLYDRINDAETGAEPIMTILFLDVFEGFRDKIEQERRWDEQRRLNAEHTRAKRVRQYVTRYSAPELRELAEKREVSPDGTKQEIAERIVDSLQAKGL